MFTYNEKKKLLKAMNFEYLNPEKYIFLAQD